ncbi:MAG: HD domain-containing protein [Planctomycetes bacterium]|nr:HD domain-containing protein [Planctomycetota bacterium]
MSSAKRFSVLRDPVHGDVYLTHEELAVLDTPEMQRLRGVKQLGTAYLVYPGALHTRFDHSIGVLHMTQKMIEAVNRNFELQPRDTLGVSEREARILRIAALVHDVTHIPFGHHIEDQAGLFERHDSGVRFRRVLGPESELGRRLERFGVRKEVLSTLLAAKNREPAHGEPTVPPYWSQILSDTICSDILDYLQRDAYFTGLQLGVDPRVASYFKIDRASGNLYLDLAKRELLREDILSEAIRLLEARYYFSERVYYHHAKVASGALVARAVELAIAHELLREEDLYDRTDASLFELLEQRAAPAEPELARRIQSLCERFRNRRLPKRACVFPRYENRAVQDDLVARYFAPEARAARSAVEERIADLVHFGTGKRVEVMLHCPAARMQLKEAETHVRWPGESTVRPLSAFADRVPRLADLERAYRDLWKFYVFADSSDPALLRKVQEVALGEFPGAKSVYRIEDAI